MKDSFGGQGGMEGIIGAGKEMHQASKLFYSSGDVFRTSVGKWSLGVYMVKDVFGKFIKDFEDANGLHRRTWKKDIADMGGIITAAFSAFGKAKWIDTVADMVNSIYGVRKALERTYGAFGGAGDSFTSGIMQQTKMTNEFGARWRDNLESFSAIADRLGSLNFDMNMVGDNTILAKAMNMSEEMAANISTAFKFAGATTKTTMSFMEEVNKGATKLGLSPSLVAENIAASEKSMFRFALNTDKGRVKLQQMALMSSKMGTNIDNMVSAMDQFRTVGGAMEGSARLSLLGMNTNAMQMLANARSSDPAKFFEQAMSHLKKFSDSKTGQLSPVGYDVANALGPMLNMSFDEIQKALYRLNDPREKDAMMKHYKSMKERGVLMQTITEKISNSMYGILMFVSPFIDKITKVIDYLTSNAALLKALLVVASVGIPILKFLQGRAAAQAASQQLKNSVLDAISGPNRLKSSANRIALRNWAGRQGILDVDDEWTKNGRGKPGSLFNNDKYRMDGIMGGRGQRRGSSGGGLSGGVGTNVARDISEQTKLMAGQAKLMLASVPAMLAFAGSVWMLARAFKTFGEVEWKGVGIGMVVITGMIGAMWALSKSKVGWEAALVMGALGGATWLAAMAFKTLSDAILPLLGQGMAMAKVAAGLGAISLALATVGASSMLSLIGAGGLWAGMRTIKKIGDLAVTYSTPINELANGLNNLADALSKIQSISVTPINLDNVKSLSKISSNNRIQVGTGNSEAGKVPDVLHVHVYSTIKQDGITTATAYGDTLVSLNTGRGVSQ